MVLDPHSSPRLKAGAFCGQRGKYAPQYDRRTMELWLCPQFQYTYAGDDLGGRPKDMSLYTDGRVDFDLMAKSDRFIERLDVLSNEIGSGKRIVLMCSERDPVCCHRFVLISRNLKKFGHNITHILGSSETHPNRFLESQEALERRMMHSLAGYATPNLFDSAEVTLDRAFNAQGRKIAYKLKEKNDNGRNGGIVGKA